jgi:preprotein translocase subunit SecB
MDTVLQLKEYFFPYVEVAADPKITDMNDAAKSDFMVNVDTLPIDKEENKYQVTLEVVSQPESEEKRQFYAIKLISVGFFQVTPEWQDKDKLLRVTGASMLYSAAREFLITITSRGPWGAIMLPTASFLKIYEANRNEATNPSPAE